MLSICIGVGAILLINKSNPKKEIPQRDFIIVTATGKSNYNFPVALDKGITVGEAALYFAPSYSSLQRKQGLKYIELQPDQRINSDIQIKIN